MVSFAAEDRKINQEKLCKQNKNAGMLTGMSSIIHSILNMCLIVCL